VVTERNLHPGALVGPSTGTGAQPILRLESVGRTRLVIDVPEDYAIGIREGQQVNFTADAIPGKTFHAPIARISHAIDEKTRTMAVELGIHNEPQLIPGMFVTVQWRAQRTASTLSVPTTAIANDLQRTFVIRVNNGKVEWIDVKPGVTVGNSIEVFGDLQANDLVAVRGTDELKPGTQVGVKQQ
jgi:RND family efflux transporter MFP subunit